MAEWAIVPFDREFERSSFSCGQPALDDFIRLRVSQYEKRRLGKTFVAIDSAGNEVLGYHTLAAGAVAFQNLPASSSRKLPSHPVPVVLLARLAVDRKFQGQKIGEGLLLDALHRSKLLSAQIGVHAVEVLAIDESAAAFYRKFGFVPLLDDPMHLFLPIASIAVD